MWKFLLFGLIPGLYFAGSDDGGGGGGGSDDDETEDKDDAKKKGDDKPEGFDQDQVNKLVGAARQKGGEKAVSALFEKLGVKDADELETLIKKTREADEAALSEKQKLEKTAKDALDGKTAAETKLAEREKEITNRLMTSDIRILAVEVVMDKEGKNVTRGAFRKDALDDVALLIDRTDITEKDGKFEGIEKALAALAKAKPWLLAEKTPEGTRGKGTPPGPKQKLGEGQGEQKRKPTPL